MGIHETAIIHPSVKLAEGVTVGPYTVIEEDVTVGRGTVIGPHVVIRPFVEIGEDNVIRQFVSIGEVPQDLKFAGEKTSIVIGDRNTIREFVTINRGTGGGGGVTTIGDDCLLMAYTHVAHDCHVGNRVVIANSVQMGGHVVVDDNAVIGGVTGVHQFVRIGTYSMIGGGTAVVQDVAPFTTVSGPRAGLFGLNLIGLKRSGMNAEAISSLKKTYGMIFKSGLTVKQVREKFQEGSGHSKEAELLLEFVESSKRGVCR